MGAPIWEGAHVEIIPARPAPEGERIGIRGAVAVAEKPQPFAEQSLDLGQIAAQDLAIGRLGRGIRRRPKVRSACAKDRPEPDDVNGRGEVGEQLVGAAEGERVVERQYRAVRMEPGDKGDDRDRLGINATVQP